MCLRWFPIPPKGLIRQISEWYTLPQDCLVRPLPGAAAPPVRRHLRFMAPRARSALCDLAVFFTICALVGSVMQRKVGAQSSQDESQIRDSLKTFTDVYALV